MSNSDIATTYLTSWSTGDFETLRSTLTPDVTFTGPMGTATGIDECMQGLQGMARTMAAIRVIHMWEDGDDVITWYELDRTDLDVPIPTVNWSHFVAGRISAIQAVFDARPLVG
jgi:ketosteroid isomerase-like protein